jgi:hypothetical protein
MEQSALEQAASDGATEARLARDRASFLAHERHTLGLPSLFYGTLRAPEIFEIVVGRPRRDAAVEHVVLPYCELGRIVAGQHFPGIFPTDEESDVTCILVEDLDARESLRVAWYEWDEYRLDRFTTQDGRVGQAFVPDVDAIHRVHGGIDFRPWSYEEWRASYLEETVAGARQWMALMPPIEARLA